MREVKTYQSSCLVGLSVLDSACDGSGSNSESKSIASHNGIYNKISIVIGSSRAHLSRNRRAITWVSNYSRPIWTFCNWIPVIGYPRDSHVNYARFYGFLRNVLFSFQNLGKVLQMFSLKRSSHKTFLIPKFVIDMIISNWTSCRTI